MRGWATQTRNLYTLHDQIFHAILITHGIQNANVRMIQAGNRFGFPLEPLLPDRVPGELCRQNFDGDGPFQPRVPGAVDFPHATRAERCKDFVGPESGTWSQRHTGRDYTFGGLRLLPSALSRTYDGNTEAISHFPIWR